MRWFIIEYGCDKRTDLCVCSILPCKTENVDLSDILYSFHMMTPARKQEVQNPGLTALHCINVLFIIPITSLIPGR